MILFKHPDSFVAQAHGLANHALLAPLRTALEEIEQEWSEAPAEDQPWIYDAIFVMRCLLECREHAELERMAA